VKNTIKFISIGMVMVLLLMSQWSVNKSVEAADAADNDVEWMDSSAAVVTHYAPGSTTSTAKFYINDADLGVTQSGTSTWTYVANSGAIAAGTNNLNLETGAISTTAVNTSNMTFALSDSDFDAGATPLVQGSLYAQLGTANVAVTSYNNTNGTMGSALITISANNPLVAHYQFTAADQYAVAAHRAKVTSTSDSTGEWVAIGEVADEGSSTANHNSGIFLGSILIGTDASYETAADGTVWVRDGDTLTVTYYAAIDSDGNDGAVIASTTATIDASDPEISITGPADGELTSDESPTLSFTISDGGSGFDADIVDYTGHIAVQVNGCDVPDGELTLTSHSASSMSFSYTSGIQTDYNDASTPNASCSTAQRTGGGFNVSSTSGPFADNAGTLAEALDASETGVDVADGSLFAVGDVITTGSEDMTVVSISTNTLTVTRGSNSTTAAIAAIGAEIGVTADASRTTHGTQFSWQVTTVDLAGNTETTTASSMNIVIDSVAPTFTSSSAVTAAKAWNSVDSADESDNSSLKLAFRESIDSASVAASDFVVSGTGVTSGDIVSVTMGGTKANSDKYIYLDLAEDLAPNATPKVVLVGSISDLAGNALTPSAAETASDDGGKVIGKADDGVAPTLSSVTRDVALIDDGGEAVFTFESNENLTKTSETIANGCTCGSVTGPENSDVGGSGINIGTNKLSASLTDPDSGTATFKESNSAFDINGVYGVTLLGRDAIGNIGTVGDVKVSNEDVSAAVTSTVS